MDSADRAIAIVGVGAILPDAPNAPAFWQNIVNKRYSITDVPPERWNPDFYYDADPYAPDKTYSKIGGWVRDFEFDWKRYRMPPKVAASMDEGQQWAVTIAAEALADYGYSKRSLNTEKTAVILGTAMGGERHYITQNRVVFPEFADALQTSGAFNQLPSSVREQIISEWHHTIDQRIPRINEDSMPGELPNVVSGRVANMLNLRGPNFITDAACASSFAAINAAIEMLTEHQIDAAITGGVDRNMGAPIFVKFCKIGALSATGSRPFGAGADGFVMGEGSGAFLLKRLTDAEQNGDKIYAVIRGVGGSSDGKGKGITAPNPIGQILSIERAWENAGLDPATATLVEAHGTSTRVGDVVEVESLAKVFSGAATNSIALGSAKSNIGHLKAGAGAAGLLKAALAIHHKILPPTLNAKEPNANIDFSRTPFAVNHEAREWESANGDPRRCGVSAYGFGGTNFHVVLEEHIPGALTQKNKQFTGVSLTESTSGKASNGATTQATSVATTSVSPKPAPVRGIFALGAGSPSELQDKLNESLNRVEHGWTPPIAALPGTAVIQSPERLIIDYGDHDQLLDRLQKARKVMSFDNPQAWKAVQSQGIFRGSGRPKGKVAFMFPGQGSQYVNMGRELAELSPTVAKIFDDADAVMQPILGKPLTDYIFVDPDDSSAVMQATFDLMQTEICQPAMLTLDMAMMALLADYGFKPDIVMGHSLGEYAALIAAGVMPFADALEATAARGGEMAAMNLDDNGKMAAVLAPMDVVEQVLGSIDGYVVPANINSNSQCVFGGASEPVEQAVAKFEADGYKAMIIPVSHAFHTEIISPAGVPLRKVLDRLDVREANLPIVANVTGGMYPTTVTAIKDNLQKQVSSTVQWVKGLNTLYDYGVRLFVEVGPKRALRGFANDVFADKDDVIALLTNHPKQGTLPTFNQALCGLYAAGYNGDQSSVNSEQLTVDSQPAAPVAREEKMDGNGSTPTNLDALSQLLAQALQQNSLQSPVINQPYDRNAPPNGSVVISGTGLGLPGAEKSVMDPENALRILRGEQFVDLIPERFRQLMVDKRITRLVKGEDGSGKFVTIEDTAKVIKLAGRPGYFDLAEEYGVDHKLIEALDITTQLAMAAGLDALREAGIPLAQRYRTATTGKVIAQDWKLPRSLRDDTGVVFASAFPGGDRFAEEFGRYYAYVNRVEQVEMLEDLRHYTQDNNTLTELNRRIGELRNELEREPYVFDRRFLFRILSMGHSQFAQYIGARGPNTQVNAACASTAQGVAIAEDWIRNGRCRRVIVIGADDVTGDNLMDWVGAGFLAVGAATTEDRVDHAALPFDKRRHGTILGMGACALVVESEDAVRERGMRGIVELLSSETNNSAFHGTRLDVEHISMVMNNLVTSAERRFGLNRYAMAPQTVFMSHETFTPARGGSAAAEVMALRETFGEAANEVIVANTKGFTGHPMGVGVEDVIAVKILEHGIVPPVPNYKEVDPDLGTLNLSRGGRYPVQYALHLAAGFGSQISMTLTRRIPGSLNRIDNKPMYERWLADISGYDRAEIEVVKRVLRIKAIGAPPRLPMPNRWQAGTGPVVRVSGQSSVVSDQWTVDSGQFTVTSGAVAPPVVKPQPSAPKLEPAPEPVKVEKVVVEEKKVETAVPIPVSPPPPAPTPEPAGDPIADKIVSLVAEQTGYPEDMLDLDLDLEADLGIDTVKQAETFAAIRNEFEIPARDDLNLRQYNTMEKVIGFVKEMRPDLVKVEETAVVQPITTPQTPAPTGIAARIVSLVAEQTGYPEDMLDLDLDLEADLGIDTVKQAETFAAIRNEFDIPARDDLNLRQYNTMEKVIGFVEEMRPDLKDEGGGMKVEETAIPQSPIPNLQAPVSPASDSITAKIIALIAEQTGYPEDMLELDLDLEADLGIDTVKQAETFAAIRKEFDIPLRDDLNLREYNTIEKVIGFVKSESGVVEAETAVVQPSQVSSPQSSASDDIQAKIIALIAEQTGYPEDMLELDLDLEADLGIDTVKQAETFAAIRKEFDIPLRDDLNLREYNTIEKVIGFVKAEGKGQKTETAVAPVLSPQSPASDDIQAKIIALIAEQTGYPEDMLELDLDLEADLGIDTVKQAETFAAIRKEFDIPLRDDLNLREYNTIEKVIGFVKSESGVVEAETAVPTPTPTTSDSQPATDNVQAKIIALIADQTGYPEDMLELDLDLEADLGIDTVKQAETFAAIRKEFNIPLRDDLNLREYNTIEKVIGFVKSESGVVEVETTVTTPTLATSDALPATNYALRNTQYALETADTMPRRVVVPALRPALDLCKSTGVTLDKQSRVIVAMDEKGVGKALTGRLRKLGVTVLTLKTQKATDLVEKQMAAWLADGPIQGVYWLPALDAEPALDLMTLETWRELNRVRVKNLYTTMRALYDSVSEAGCFLVSGTRMGGLHGYGEDGATSPLGGGVTGFTKAYKRERPDVLVKAVDFVASRQTAKPADLLIAETLTDPGIVEVGYHNDQRYTVTFVEETAVYTNEGMKLDNDTVYLVTGAAGGITSEITADLAANSGGTFYLLDLVAEPDRNDANIALFRNDLEALNQQFVAEIKAAGERATPVAVQKKVAVVERDEAALRAIEAVEAAGGTAHYFSVNLLDGKAVTAVVDHVRANYGKIDVLIHAGGIEISKTLPDKPAEQFNLVYDIKADGFFSLLSAAQNMPIGATIVFSSIAGRFGNNGQTDYSAANDLLCKLTSSLRQWRPETKGIAIDWTAWGGIGMASRGSLPKIMAFAGIDMLPPEAGVPTVRRELVASAFKGEVVVGGALGVMVEEFDETGGLDVEKAKDYLTQRRKERKGKTKDLPLVGEVTAATLYGGLTVETELDPKVQPFLFDHAPDEGTPWLPGVMATEAMAEVATVLLPGFSVTAVTDEEMMGAFKFFRNQPRTLYLNTQLVPAGDGFVARTTLRSITPPAREGQPVREQQHFAAPVALTANSPQTDAIDFKAPKTSSLPIKAAEIYKDFFHGPAYQVIERAKVNKKTAVALMADKLPPNMEPADANELLAPRVVELCFQLAALWHQKVNNAIGFPLGFDSLTVYQQEVDAGKQRLYAKLQTDNGERFNVQVVDTKGNVYVDLKGYLTVSRPA